MPALAAGGKGGEMSLIMSLAVLSSPVRRCCGGWVMTSPADAPATSPGPQSPAEVLKSRGYVVLLVFGAIVGIPAAVVVFSS